MDDMSMSKPIVIMKASNGLKVSTDDKIVAVVCNKHQLVFEVRFGGAETARTDRPWVVVCGLAYRMCSASFHAQTACKADALQWHAALEMVAAAGDA